MGVVMAVPSVLADGHPSGQDGPGADCHSGYVSVYVRDSGTVGPGELVDVYIYWTNYDNVAVYWQDRSDGDYHGPAWERGNAAADGPSDECHSYVNTEIPTPLEPGNYQACVFGAHNGDAGPDNYNDRRCDRWRTIRVELPDLSVSHDVPDEVEVGDTFTATATVANSGGVNAPNVQVSQALDGAEALGPAEASTDNLRAGDALTLSYEARATELGSIGVSSEAASVITDDLQVTAGPVEGSIDVLGPQISMERDMPDAVNSGEVFQVNVTYTNTGELAAGDVELSDTFDSAYTPVPNGLAVEEPDVPEEPPEEAPSAPSTPGQPGSVSPQAPQLDVFEYGQPAAYESADPVTVKGEETTTFHWGSFELAPGESVEVSYTLVAPVHLPVVGLEEPDQPEPPEEPPEEVPVLPPEDPEPPEEPPTGPVVVDDNDGEYVFASGADFVAPSGLGFSSSADSTQAVLAVHNTFVEEPEPPEEPPEPPVEP